MVGKVRVGVVDGDAAAGADIAIKAAVWLFEERAPHVRLHEKRRFCAPVVVGEDGVRLKIVDEQLHILEAVGGDILDKLVHFVRMLIKRRERVFKAHEEVALLKNARAHEARDQLLVSGCGARLGAALLPALGAVCGDVRCVDILTPAGDVRTDRQPVAVQRASPRAHLREN